MTIARIQYSGVGARIYAPEGPYGSLGSPPFPSFKPGEVVDGDGEGEFTFVLLSVMTPAILNQGDLLFWDTSFRANVAVSGAGAFGVGAHAGTLFLGGNQSEEQLTSPPPVVNNYQANFAVAGVYGVFAQRDGASLVKGAALAAGGPLSTTAVPGQVNSGAGAVGSYTLAGAYINPASVTFTANTTSGSAVLLASSSNYGVSVGMQLSGTGIPTGAVVKDVNGPAVTMSAAATAAGTGVTVTAAQRVAIGATTNASNLITNVNTIAGIYPNCTLAGTGLGAAAVVTGISGSAGNYTLQLSVPSTATATGIALTASGYLEAMLTEIYVSTAN